jgi:hypothetical protein
MFLVNATKQLDGKLQVPCYLYPSLILLWTTQGCSNGIASVRFAGTATEVVPLCDKQHLVYLLFDDLSDDNFLFPAPDIQRILPPQIEQASNKVFAADGAGAPDLAYECSPDQIEVGDVIFCKYRAPGQTKRQGHRGRVAIVRENGTCDVVFDGYGVSRGCVFYDRILLFINSLTIVFCVCTALARLQSSQV